jgi:hypothetical protein
MDSNMVCLSVAEIEKGELAFAFCSVVVAEGSACDLHLGEAGTARKAPHTLTDQRLADYKKNAPPTG